MKVIETTDATASLADFAAKIESGPVIVTTGGRPVAALVPLENTDLETISLSANPEFLELIERSRARVATDGGIASEDMRRRFDAEASFGG